MNVISSLENMGLSLSLRENDKLSVKRLARLNREEREYALCLARQHKDSIVGELHKRSLSLSGEPTPEQIAHARRMLVDCPSSGGKLHCWNCSRCDAARTCTAWRSRRADVEFFRKSGEPYSLSLVKEVLEVLQ